MTNNVEGKKCVLLLEDKLTCNVQMTNNVTANKLFFKPLGFMRLAPFVSVVMYKSSFL